MKHFIIDGNNLIGKIKVLNQTQKKNKQQSREKLALMISRYFSARKAIISLHFDGFENEKITVPGLKIIYSDNITADEKIRQEIQAARNRRNVVLVTSDSNLAEFGHVCSCQVLKSEEFTRLMNSSRDQNEEQMRIDMLRDNDEFKKIFGIK